MVLQAASCAPFLILAQVNSKSSKICAYIICIVILLALCTVLYNMWRKSQ